jgi:hypothetical protein
MKHTELRKPSNLIKLKTKPDMVKVKQSPGLEGSRGLRLPDFKKIGT